MCWSGSQQRSVSPLSFLSLSPSLSLGRVLYPALVVLNDLELLVGGAGDVVERHVRAVLEAGNSEEKSI